MTTIRIAAIGALVAAILLARHGRVARRAAGSPLTFALALPPSTRTDVLWGAGIALFAVLAVTGAVVELGSGSIASGTAIGLLWCVPVLLLAALEEVVFRGFVIDGALAWVHSKPAALLVSSALFGLTHGLNPGASWVAASSSFLGGLAYGTARLRRGDLALAIGMHAAWNAAQGPLLGFPVSGHRVDAVAHVTFTGTRWMSDDVYGFEATAPGFAARLCVLGLLAVYLFWRRPRKAN